MQRRSAEELNSISRRIIGCAITVHRRIGPGCLESAYTPCLALEFSKARLDYRREVALALRYDELVVPRAYVADFVVEETIVVEIKAVAPSPSAIGDSYRHTSSSPAARSAW